MATVKDTFSGVSRYYLHVYTKLSSQSASGNYSTIYYRIRIYKTAGSGYWGSAYVNHYGWVHSSEGDQWNDSTISFDFRNGKQTGYITFKSGYFRVYHRSDGTGSYWVSSKFKLYNLGTAYASTGTIGLPSLAKVPPAPTAVRLTYIKPDRMNFRFTNNGDGGTRVLEWQIGYGKNGKREEYQKGDGYDTVKLKYQDTRYYFWARGRNAVGWGPWSNRISAVTGVFPTPKPKALSVTNRTMTSFKYRFTNQGYGIGHKQWQIGYGTSSGSPQKYLNGVGGTTYIKDLKPATRYYVWARGQNKGGWGPWSNRLSIKTMAGCRIKENGTWRYALPYVKYQGEWKLAQPYIKHVGLWKRQSDD